jgi:hypothetical protein
VSVMANQKMPNLKTPAGLYGRTLSLLGDGLLRIDQEYKIQGTHRGLDCIGRYWIFGICEKCKGEVRYIRGLEEVVVPWEKFGIFLPPFSLTEAKLVDAHTTNIGFLSSLPLPPNSPQGPMAFKLEKNMNHESVADILKSIQDMREPIAIGRGHGANAVSEKIKKMLDASYKEPIQLSALAKKLKLNPAVM